jgi:hypothetical protein
MHSRSRFLGVILKSLGVVTLRASRMRDEQVRYDEIGLRAVRGPTSQARIAEQLGASKAMVNCLPPRG